MFSFIHVTKIPSVIFVSTLDEDLPTVSVDESRLLRPLHFAVSIPILLLSSRPCVNLQMTPFGVEVGRHPSRPETDDRVRVKSLL